MPEGMVWPLDSVKEVVSDEPLIVFQGVDLDFLGDENGLKYKLTINLHMKGDACQTNPNSLQQFSPRFPKRKLAPVGSARAQESMGMLSASSVTARDGSQATIDEAIDTLDFGVDEVTKP